MSRSIRVAKRRAPPSSDAWDFFHAAGDGDAELLSTLHKARIYNSQHRGCSVVQRQDSMLHENDLPCEHYAASIYKLTSIVFVYPEPISIATSAVSILPALQVLGKMWQSGFSPTTFDISHYSISPNSTMTFWPWHLVVSRDAMSMSKFTRKLLLTQPLLLTAGVNERLMYYRQESRFNFFEAVCQCIIAIGNRAAQQSTSLRSVKHGTANAQCQSCRCNTHTMCQIVNNILSRCRMIADYEIDTPELIETLSNII